MTRYTLHALRKKLDKTTTMFVCFSESGDGIEVARFHGTDHIGTRTLSRVEARKLYRALRGAGYEPTEPGNRG